MHVEQGETIMQQSQQTDPSINNQILQDELKLIEVCQEIGGIAGSNNQYTLIINLAY